MKDAIIIFCTLIIFFLFYRRRLLHEQEASKQSTNDEYVDCPTLSESVTTIDVTDLVTTQCVSIMKESTCENVDKSETDNVVEDTLLIEKTDKLDMNYIQENLPKGRFIMNLSYYTRELYRTYINHKQGIDCQLNDWVPVNYRFYGLRTQLHFKCRMCNYETTIWSEPQESDELEINAAAATSTITAGIGYSTLEEVCAGMNV